jgi:hypothetical protein
MYAVLRDAGYKRSYFFFKKRERLGRAALVTRSRFKSESDKPEPSVVASLLLACTTVTLLS